VFVCVRSACVCVVCAVCVCVVCVCVVCVCVWCVARILVSVTGGRSSEYVLLHNACNLLCDSCKPRAPFCTILY